MGVPAREAPYLTLGHFFQDKLQTVSMLHNVQQSNVSVKRLGAASFPPWGDCSIIEYTINTLFYFIFEDRNASLYVYNYNVVHVYFRTKVIILSYVRKYFRKYCRISTFVPSKVQYLRSYLLPSKVP